MRRAPKYVLVALPLCLLLCFYVVAVTNSPPFASSFQSLLPSSSSSSSLSGDHDLSTTAEAALPRRNRLEHSLPHHHDDDYDESLSTVFGERRIRVVAPIHTLHEVEAQMMPFGKDEGSRCAAAAAETTTEGAAHRRAVGLASPRSTTKKTQLLPSPSSSPSSFLLFDVPRDAEEQGHYRFRGTKPQHWVSSYHSSSTSSSSAVAKSSRSQVVGSSSGSHRSPPFSSASSSSSRPREEEEEVPTTASAIKKRHDVVVASSIPTLSRELIQTAAAVDEMMLLGSERGGWGTWALPWRSFWCTRWV